MDWLKIVSCVKPVLLIVIAVLIGMSCYKIFRYLAGHKKTEDEALLAKERLLNMQYANINVQRAYEELKLFISQNGISYEWGHSVSPQEYIAFKAVVSAIIAALLMVYRGFSLGNLFLAVCFFFGFYWLFGWRDKQKNKKYNEKMLTDIQTIYNTLIIQSTSGVFLTDALTECYKQVQSVRLKDALRELTNSIIAKHDVNAALDVFSIKFQNQYIDTLCTTLKQSQQSGQTRELLTDVSEQLTDVVHAINIRQQAAIDTKISLLQVAIFAVITAIIMFSVMTSVLTSVGSF